MTERDPHGTTPNQPGAKLDSGKARAGLAIGGFARALLAVSDVATFGASKYTPNGWVSVPDGIERYTDAMYRHLLAEGAGEAHDEQTGLAHAAHAAWNALARLELMLREGLEQPGVVPSIGPDRRKGAEPAATTEQSSVADEDGWIKWEGGECPVAPGTAVDVRYRNGEVAMNVPALQRRWFGSRCAESWGRIGGHGGEIVAYRLSKEASHG